MIDEPDEDLEVEENTPNIEEAGDSKIAKTRYPQTVTNKDIVWNQVSLIQLSEVEDFDEEKKRWCIDVWTPKRLATENKKRNEEGRTEDRPPLMNQLGRGGIRERVEHQFNLHMKLECILDKSKISIDASITMQLLLSQMILRCPEMMLLPCEKSGTENSIIQIMDISTNNDKFRI